MTIVIDTPVRPSRDSFGYGSYRYSSVTEEPAQVVLNGNQEFLGAVLGGPKRFHYTSRDKLHVAMQDPYGSGRNKAGYGVATVSLGIQAIHQTFAAHVPLSLRPDTLWYFIVHEVAKFVRQNPRECAGLFTDTPESKQTIEVRDDSLRYDAPSDWMRSINLVRDPLAAKIGDPTMELFLPRFSTSTIEDETALLVALMDTVSPFYRYQWTTRCGIPQIRLEGDAADWRKLYDYTEQLAYKFQGLIGYFADLLPVLQKIAETAAGTTPDEEFWRSIYKYKSESGAPQVSGWITAFFAYVQTGQGSIIKDTFDWRRSGSYSTNKFPSHVSKVPFVWDYLGTLYDMAFVTGVTGVDYDGSFLEPRLGFAVVEV